MPQVTRDEYLKINGVPLATPAWEIVDLAPLWTGPDVRGSDRLLPGASGVIPYRRRPTVSKRSLPMFVFGDFDQDGNPNADVRAGLEENVVYLREQIGDPTEVGDGTLPAVLYMPSGDTWEADVHVERLEFGLLGKRGLAAVLDISIPGGSFSPTSS